MGKVLFLANTDWYLWNFRLPLFQELRKQGWEVVLASPSGPWGERLAAEGFRWIAFDFARHGLNPVAESLTLMRLIRLYRSERPAVAHHFTIKCVLYGGIAAHLSGVRAIVNAVTGLGTLFTTRGVKTAILMPFIRMLYRFVFRGSQVIFQNPDDRAEFEKRRLLDDASVHIIRGSGVDLVRFHPPDTPPSSPPIVVVLVARLIHEKGIAEFVEAARILRAEGHAARFLVVGSADPQHPAAIDEATLDAWRHAGEVEFLGHRDDVGDLLQSAHVACLPSWREGTPRSLLEAMACGLPVVATDVPGCREVTRNGDNGFLVPVRNPPALADGIRTLLNDPACRVRMGMRSRQRADEEFSQKSVIQRTIAIYGSALTQG